ncbi:hypothetical protein BMT54_08755 [Pasteurellaceae bacterium 15-036681]|nr:hypothetical protein BMT54_08755 [Pasteurellaceae bacterium 15-036681]
MKLKLNSMLSATLISLLLTACGSGGGHTTHQPIQEPVVKKVPKPDIEHKENKENEPKKNTTPKDESRENVITHTINPPLEIVEASQELPREFNWKQDDTLYSLYSLQLEGRNLALVPSGDTKIQRKEVETLIDDNGDVSAYYGYAIAEAKDKLSIAKVKNIYYMPFFGHKDKAERTIEMKEDLQYQGKMFYRYNKEDNDILTAKVNAEYKSSEKQLTMDIIGKDKTWKLQDDEGNSYVDISKGEFVGSLYSNGEENGELTGYTYGHRGEVLVGYAEHPDSDPKKSWEGVLGAKAK